MKRVIKCMGMMALVALAFTSCKKNEEKSVFTAATQQFVIEDEDRAYVDANQKIHFEEGDVCMMFNISTADPMTSHCATYAAIEDGNVVEFRNCGLGTVAENILDDGYYAFYPGNVGFENHVVTELEMGENKSAFLVAPTQEYRPDAVALEHMYMAAKVAPTETAHLADAHFTFRNLCGILTLKPYEATPRTVTSIEIVNNGMNLTGWVELILSELDPIEMQDMFNRWNPADAAYMSELNLYKDRIGYHVYDAMPTATALAPTGVIGNTVTLNVPNVTLGTSKATTPAFNIVLRPLAFAFGGQIIFHFDNGDIKPVNITSASDIQKYFMKPNVVKSIGLNLDTH